MVSKANYYENVKVHLDGNHPLGKRIQSLLDEIIERLPEEEQFQMKGVIGFNPRELAVKFWDTVSKTMPIVPNLNPTNRDGVCTFNITDTVEGSNFIITIVIDDLNERSDLYIKGLIAHEISEMSYAWNTVRNESPKYAKLKPRAREVMIGRILKIDAPIDSKEYQEHEEAVNQEAIRLGFENEIQELESP